MDSTIIGFRTAEPPLTEAMFCTWFGSAVPGDRIVYHRGFLAVDASPLTSIVPDAERRALLRVAERALQLAEDGLVHLVQRRMGEGDFTYLAIARPRARSRAGTLASVLAAAKPTSVAA
ncbi:hypothetical protein [Roseicella aquatilis]|uniref:Uncharacterized protein n=1 Tax=Roseicella aquatilis TaxID=2527868 RepID=A0A4R4DTW7_9PROT|nr:hypothetical protein [Roseicella aquatilis]TCZ63590.1 hypothetical protein EXY23_09385 [Roseicella aquatilis]